MAHLFLASRDLGSDINSAKHTFTSWDGCMSKAYCKWPVIVGIVCGSLIALAILTCLVRCLCCGAECCCACFSCCNRCCPSPSRRNDQPYYPPPQPYYGQPPYGQPPYGQYQPQPQPVYGAGVAAPPGAGLRNAPVAQTAMFESSSRPKYNEDALPPMPSWDTAKSHHIEEEVEMEKLNPPSTPHERLLPNDDTMRYQNPEPVSDHHAGDLGAMHGPQSTYDDYQDQGYGQARTVAGATPSRGPQHNYEQYRQVASPVSTSGVSTGYPPTRHTTDPYNDFPQSQPYPDSSRQSYVNNYEPPRQNWGRPQPNTFSAPFQASQQQQAPQQQSGYQAYSHSEYQQPSPQPPYKAYGASPPPNPYSSPSQSTPFVARRPVQGSWRDI